MSEKFVSQDVMAMAGLIERLQCDLDEAKKRAERFGRELTDLTNIHERMLHDYHDVQDKWASAEARLEEAREENSKLREFRKVIYDHLDKALIAMDRWPKDSAPREKWLIRWTYLLQAVAAAPRIEDLPEVALAATEVNHDGA